MTLLLPKNAEMHEEINKPIFVVGSPRSGTSILAWCLGHHPNIFPVPESNWMGDFAVNVAKSYQVGAARGIFSILSAMDVSRDEFFSHIGRSINSLVLQHRCDLDRKRLIIAVQRLLKEEGLYLGEVTGELDAATSAAIRQYGIANGLLYSELVDSLRTAASDSGYKTRWVDQTPEYLLPYLWSAQAVSMRFIHPHRAGRGFSRALSAQFPSHRRDACGGERRRSVQILAAHG